MAEGARTATRIRTVRRDKLDPTPAGADDKIYLSGLVVLPRQFFEQGKGWVTVDGYDIYVLATSRVQAVAGGPKRPYRPGDVKADDRLEIDGDTWEIEGNPADYEKGRTRKATLIRVKRVGAA